MRRTLRILRCAAAVLALVALAPGDEAPGNTLTRVRLTVIKTPEALIATKDGRIRCGERCSAAYRRGSIVTLYAAPKPDFDFAGWSRGCIGVAASCVLAVDRATVVRAQFERKPVLFSAIVGGGGAVESTPPGIVCGRARADCIATFGAGEIVTFAAHPRPESTLDAWGADCAHATGSSCTIRVRLDGGNVSARFRRQVPEPGDQSVFTEVRNAAAVRSDPPGIDCPPTCGTTFPSATRITLSGQSHFSWGGDCVGFGTSCTLVADTSLGITATRPPPPAPPPVPSFVNVVVSGNGVVRGGSINCDSRGRFADCQGMFQFGSEVVLRAIARRGYRFGGWFGFCRYRKLNPRCTLRASTRKTAIAVFKR
jgi:hypothetical protein